MENFALQNKVKFWHEVKRKRLLKLSNVINGKNSDSEIAHIFHDQFLPSQPEVSNVAAIEVSNKIQELWPVSREMKLNLSTVTMKKLISRLSSGQGRDSVNTVFLRNA